jgi:hypothetical protein
VRSHNLPNCPEVTEEIPVPIEPVLRGAEIAGRVGFIGGSNAGVEARGDAVLIPEIGEEDGMAEVRIDVPLNPIFSISLTNPSRM